MSLPVRTRTLLRSSLSEKVKRMAVCPRRTPLVLGLLLAFAGGLYGLSRILHPDPPPARVDGGFDWVAWLDDLSDGAFARPSGAWRLELPEDHGAHPDARAETWSVSAHLRSEDGEPLGFQFALLRVGIVPPHAPQPESDWALRALYRAHVMLAGGSGGPDGAEERFSRGAPGVAGHDAGLGQVWLDDWSLRFSRSGEPLTVEATVEGTKVELELTPAKAALPLNEEGGGGPARGYAITRMEVEGSIQRDGRRERVSGLAWFDHFWGELPLPGGPIARDRLQLQLDDGVELFVIRSRRRDGGGTPTVEGAVIGPEGAVERLDGSALEMEALEAWGRGDAAWPVGWRLEGEGLDLTVSPFAEDRLHDFAEPLWSGAVSVEGRFGDRRVSGLGTLQLTGYGTP